MIKPGACHRLIRPFVLGAVLSTSALAAPPDNPLLDRLVRVPGQMQVLQTSSHNRMGRNGDAELPLYKDSHGDDVVFDAAGPGCVRSMWGTAFPGTAVFKFYFDGESKPRYQVGEIDFYSGKLAEFPPPLNSYEERGQYEGLQKAGNSFVPIPFAKSLKITIANKSSFYHVLYELYPQGTPIKTFTGQEDRSALLDSFAPASGAATSQPGHEIVKAGSEQTAPGAEVVLLERKDAAGVIREMVLEADGAVEFFKGTELLMRWDNHAFNDVRAPAGMFFGCADHAADVTSLPVAVRKLDGGRVELRCRFPMPFWHHARVVWRNRSGKALGPLKAALTVGPNTIPEDRGTYFTTLYHQGQTTYHRDWPLFDSPGSGWFVGVVQSMYQEHYCEGNEHFTIDGAVSPQINGTGTEDYYLGCFWPNTVYSSPFAMSAINILTVGGSFDGAYTVPASYSRFHLEAPIPFFRSIDARIQHGGMSDIRSNYRSLAFCYLRPRTALRECDFIDVGNPGSEKAHEYMAAQSELTGMLSARPEGQYFEIADSEDGRRHAGGEITFTVAIDPKNNGVRLRRRLDQSGPPQAADVYVDGQYAGRWLHACPNAHLRWYDSDFDIRPDHTRGKSNLSVKLTVAAGAELGPFTDFNYRAYCFEPQGD
jgi:hypothetical protein